MTTASKVAMIASTIATARPLSAVCVPAVRLSVDRHGKRA